MADAKISQLPVATTPLAGTELVPIVQSATTKQTTVDAVIAAAAASGTVVASSDIGTAPNEIPLNQYLGTLAYQDSNAVNITGGAGTFTTLKVNGTMGVGAANPFPSNYRSWFGGTLANTNLYALVAEPTASVDSPAGSLNSVASVPTTAASAITVQNVRGFWAANATKGAGSTITNLHGVYISDQSQGTNNYGITSLVSSGANKWNIYASGTAANYFAGNVGIGVSAPAQELHVQSGAGTESDVRVSGNAGGSGYLDVFHSSANTGLWSSSTQPMQFGVNATERLRLGTTEAVFNDPGEDYDFRVESDTNTHALFVQGSDGFVGIGASSPTVSLQIGNGTAATNWARIYGTVSELYIGQNTAVSHFGLTDAAKILSIASYPLVMGTANAYSVVFGTNNAERLRITSAGNLSIGGTADRATTVGTAALNIFNGTAPVGTLTNGISIYSSSGEAYVMDATGNATLFSPHDAETNEWIFKSKHTPTGKVLKIDVERLLRFVNDHFGLDAVQEFIEE